MKNWILAERELPKHLELVWLSDGKKWVTLGCYVNSPNEDGHWAEHIHNGECRFEAKDGKIISDCCMSDDLQVNYWHPLPFTFLENWDSSEK